VVDRALDRVALEVLDDRRVAAPVDLQVEDGVDTGRTAERDTQVTPLDGDADRVHPVAVEHARDVPLGAQPTGCGRASGTAGVGDEWGLRHDGLASIGV